MSGRIRLMTVAGAAPLLLLTACADSPDAAPFAPEGATTSVAAPSSVTSTSVESTSGVHDEVHWGYEGDHGPEHWGELDAAYHACADGTEQSPIDLHDATDADLDDLGFDYAAVPLEIMNNGHTIQVDADGAGLIDVRGRSYEAVQFHFHAGSEHTVGGEKYPLEVHIVHAAADDALAVVGILVEIGEHNEELAVVFDNLPDDVSETPHVVDDVSVDLRGVLPASTGYFRYVGSLTTPPCTEGVLWQVLDTPVQVSAAQLATFTAIFDGNFRPTLPRGDRELERDLTPD